MNNMLDTVLEYLMHDSTWKGIISILTSLGVVIKPELMGPIVSVGMSLVGLIQVFITDRNVDKTPQIKP